MILLILYRNTENVFYFLNIVVVDPRFQLGSHLQCSHDDFEPFFPAFLLYGGSVFALLCAHNRYLKKRKFMLLACWTAKKRTVSTRHNFWNLHFKLK